MSHAARTALAAPSTVRPAGESPPELTPLAIGLGIVLSLTFGMVNAYLGLKIGLTVSASIPSAVLSMAVLRGLLRRGTVLENNVVHADRLDRRVARGGRDLHGAGPDLPRSRTRRVLEIFLIGVAAGAPRHPLDDPVPPRADDRGARDPALPGGHRLRASADGGRPRRRHGAPGLRAASRSAPLYQFAMRGLVCGARASASPSTRLHKATFGMELSPLFLGVGFLVGPRIAGTMLAGGVLGWTILLPWFDAIGGGTLGDAARHPGDRRASSRRHRHLEPLRPLRRRRRGHRRRHLGRAPRRARHDARRSRACARRRDGDRRRHAAHRARSADAASCSPASWRIAARALARARRFISRWSATLLAVVFSFFFVVVSGRIVGLVGTTSQPVSGMTITALLGTTLLPRGASASAARPASPPASPSARSSRSRSRSPAIWRRTSRPARCSAPRRAICRSAR